MLHRVTRPEKGEALEKCRGLSLFLEAKSYSVSPLEAQVLLYVGFLRPLHERVLQANRRDAFLVAEGLQILPESQDWRQGSWGCYLCHLGHIPIFCYLLGEPGG